VNIKAEKINVMDVNLIRIGIQRGKKKYKRNYNSFSKYFLSSNFYLN